MEKYGYNSSSVKLAKDGITETYNIVSYGPNTSIPDLAQGSCLYRNSYSDIWHESQDVSICQQSTICTAPSPSPTVPALSPTGSPTVVPSPTPTATPSQIAITHLPSTGFSTYTYELEFRAANLAADAEYLVKAYGGMNDNYSIETKSGDRWLNFNSSWDDFPKFKASNSGEVNGKISYRPKEGRELGTYRLQLRLRQVSNSRDIDSPIVYMIVKSTPTTTPTSLPTPTKSPTPTELTPTPTEELTPSPTPESSVEPQVEGIVDVVHVNNSPTPTPEKLLKKVNLPVLIMIIGGGLLLIPVILIKSGYVN